MLRNGAHPLPVVAPKGSTMINRRDLLKSSLAVSALLEIRTAFAQTLTQTSARGADWKDYRENYSLSSGVVYFNHASIGTVPRAVREAHVRYLEVCERNPWLYMWGGAWEQGREETRRKAAEVLGCPPQDCAIVHNTTEGFNILAQGLPLGSGDEVLFSSLNHPGASVCWEYQAERRGFRVRRFDFPLDRIQGLHPETVLEIYEREISPPTRVLVFPHIDNIVGLRHPMAELARLAHEKGVEFVAVDGAQSVGMIPVEASRSGIDFYAASPHKWLQSPKGLGLLYVRPEHMGVLKPMWVTWGQERWQGTARIYEDYGTRNLAEVLTLGDAVDFHGQVPPPRREERMKGLWSYFQRRLDQDPSLVWHSPRSWEMGASLYAVEVKGQSSQEVSEKMYSQHGFVMRPFPPPLNTLRISPNLLNSEEEIDRFFQSL